MRVRAKCNLNLSGVRYHGGDVFEISTVDAEELGSLIEIAETPVQEELKEEKTEATKKRGRKAKTEEA